MRIRLFSIFALAMLMLTSCGDEKASLRLHVEGTQLMNDAGEPVQLRGTSFGWSCFHPRFYTAENVKLLKEKWGANVVRASIGIEPEAGYLELPDSSFNMAARIVDAAIAEDIHVIVDWHSHSIFTDEAKAFFGKMVNKYKDAPNVIYEIFNEPVFDTWDEVKEYSVAVIDTIRAINPEAIVLVGSPHWCQDVDVAAAAPIEGYDNLMYTLHFYAATHKQELRDRADKALAMGLPLFISECGGMFADGSQALDHESFKTWIDWADERQMSWVCWSLSDKDEVCSMYHYNVKNTGTVKDGDMREWGRMVRDYLGRRAHDLSIVPTTDDKRVFDNGEEINIQVEMTANKAATGELKMTIQRDIDTTLLATTLLPYSLAAGDQRELAFAFEPLPAGFYVAKLYNDEAFVQQFNIGVSPINVLSPYDGQADFAAFWQASLKELAKVAPRYETSLVGEGTGRDLYLVKMQSFGNELVQCQVALPKDKSKKYRVVINYMGYGAGVWWPDTTSAAPEQIDVVVSVRGQGLNKPTNTFGDWGTYGLASKEEYYYRGAYLDVVRAIDFVWQHPNTDRKHIFAQGDSQGGAFTFAAAALDRRITAAAPGVPFLSDYRDYFAIAPWPGNAILGKAKSEGINEDDLYTMLSYFDIKNLATMVQCPIYMYAGLQDPTCPPHINFAAYNNVNAPKQYMLYPYGGHAVDSFVRDKARAAFFQGL